MKLWIGILAGIASLAVIVSAFMWQKKKSHEQ